MKKQTLWVAMLASLTLLSSISAQARPSATPLATKLPDISMMGNFQASSVKNDPDKTGFAMKEIELAIQGYLYPTIRTDVFIGLHQEAGQTEVHLEEAFLTFSGVAEGFGFKVGKKRLAIGKQNTLHSEQWAWIEQPLVISDFLGAEGLAAAGVSLEYVLPLPFFLQAELGFWQQRVGAESEAFAWANWLSHARFWSSVAPVDSVELEMGLSYLMGNGAEYQESTDKVSLLGGDVTLRYWLADGARVVMQGEAFGLRRELSAATLERWGGYGYMGYRPNTQWEFGVRGDYSESAEETKNLQKSVSAIGTYQLTETSKFRVQYSHDLVADNHGIFAQILFGVGPHSHVLQ